MTDVVAVVVVVVAAVVVLPAVAVTSLCCNELEEKCVRLRLISTVMMC